MFVCPTPPCFAQTRARTTHTHTQGKCDCDPEGGALKTAADYYENQDDPLGDQRQVIRNSAQLVQFGRDHMTKPKKDFYSKRGTGVYRRWTHHIPVRGRGAIQRRRVKVHTITTTTTTTTTTSTIRTPLFLSASMPPLGRKDRDHHQRWRKQSSDPHHPPCGV